MDAEDRLRLDYDRTNELVRSLTDGRLTLLALVPTLAGATVAVIGTPRHPAELLAVGLLGLIATFGILLYELHNSDALNAMLRHAQTLETTLGLSPRPSAPAAGGLLASPPRSRRFLGFARPGPEWAVGLVYGAALGGWAYLVVWGALATLGVAGAREAGAVVGGLVAVVVPVEVDRFARPAHAAMSCPSK